METLSDWTCEIASESSYRTYEEWKHSSGTLNPSQKSSSYRTYEEWKRQQGDRSKRTGTVLTVPMRNGNCLSQSQASLHFLWFLPYLWGMETRLANLPLKKLSESSYRTYEEWKHHHRVHANPSHAFVLTVPMRNGNLRLGSQSQGQHNVLTVPMRNGNVDVGKVLRCEERFLPYLWGMETSLSFRSVLPSLLRSYRTYEEWKRSLVSLLFVGISSVLTVPMRNGNQQFHHRTRLQNLFLPYLWGMETKKTWKLCKRSLTFLPYLWGMETSLLLFAHFRSFHVLTVPMRNGNFSLHLHPWVVTHRSYRTYEEWKHRSPFAISKSAVFLPYLWGMETWLNAKSKSCHTGYVLTVPMRNGNASVRFSFWIILCWFLPYLWGMETRFIGHFTRTIFCSYRTYEEWKLDESKDMPEVQRVLTVPMRNGNHEGRCIDDYETRKFLPYLWGMETGCEKVPMPG